MPTRDPPAPRVTALLLAAGRSRRLGDGPPKTQRLLGGRPLYAWALAACDRCLEIQEVVLVGPPPSEEASGSGPEPSPVIKPASGARSGDRPAPVHAPEPGGPPSPLPCGTTLRRVRGGATRAASVRAGLATLAPQSRWVVIHDAARPFASPELFQRVLAQARRQGAATAALRPVDALRWRTAPAAGDGPLYLDRDRLVRIQTPQAFRRDWLVAAHRNAVAETAAEAPSTPPDDAALVSALGHPVALVEGEPANFKITTPGDWERAVRHAAGDPTRTPRVGTGYDIHRLVGGRPLFLGGVRIDEARQGLIGHSDGDVACHAIADALLGAAGRGDLGAHFPPADPRWAGVSGTELLQRTAALLFEAGVEIINLDVTVLAEVPRLAPHRAAMQHAIANALSVPTHRVSLKATSAEGLGPVGATAAIAAQAVALVCSAATP
jgi:2-C-methyl-D-erythritol 4-phosphate cytidylyltransferase/2-C-methyl-D-erythritol 2,4-cyclodiphosphate synthase